MIMATMIMVVVIAIAPTAVVMVGKEILAMVLVLRVVARGDKHDEDGLEFSFLYKWSYVLVM